ncbi:MAG: PglZ domain-containing protein [Bacteroidota bacterium]|uniref:T9SS response regulator signal transducer PorX n=1 Tax=Candidatus Pollutiaquabacter sp. TaxID=3416354 RepID=UPI001A5FE0DE|nr:PglZ domain-containing protein [Bacteroidota bacterium]MBL7947780.1 PglZ domain-containing protein [Bacteroidia bacterium]MBP6010373.1 PglZ domain-containing protein [Bacteroidia bacterium]MBP7436393.1 PglZ domain-containing protein [Bacteroidia bacterium]MBP7772224.1 PglZ domain-containing protein [Bacteroidia bacterium]
MDKIRILWADDEIDLLKPHLLFLQEKGYDVTTVTNGEDALEAVRKSDFAIVFLDENMPGLSGLETLSRLKNIRADVPVIMITKSEEEHIMEQAIGSKIADYLIKPVNPNQILLALKKNLENKRLISEKTTSDYMQDFRQIGMSLSDKLNWQEWQEVYRKLVFWELELEKSSDQSMYEILTSQKNEANNLFSRFVERNYLQWLRTPDEQATPVLSHQLMKKRILPAVDASADPVFLILIDNLRYDQWKTIQPILADLYRVQDDELYCGILPTATQYARNAIFAGLMPSEIESRFPQWWKNDEDEGGKNMHEADFLGDTLKRFRKEYKFSYTKITNHNEGKELVESLSNKMQNKLNVIVYNFVDMLSHARTEMEMIRELADDEAAYRSLTKSWFEHSPLLEALRRLAEKKVRLIITTDHGTIRVKEPVKIVGDRSVNSNLRYKQGRNLNYDKKDVFEVKNPADAFLPRVNLSQAFVFTRGDQFFAYPNNYNYYVSFYRNTLQHGGISLEEMVIPFAVLTSKA